MESDRKAYHLVGSVLAQRTVGEVLPTLEANKDAIKQVVNSLNEQLKAANAERTELQKKHGIRIGEFQQAAGTQGSARRQNFNDSHRRARSHSPVCTLCKMFMPRIFPSILTPAVSREQAEAIAREQQMKEMQAAQQGGAAAEAR
jgi:Prefoldin subunit